MNWEVMKMLIKDLITIREIYRTIMMDIVHWNESTTGILRDMAIDEKTITSQVILGKTIVSNIRRMGEGMDRIITRELVDIIGMGTDDETNEAINVANEKDKEEDSD